VSTGQTRAYIGNLAVGAYQIEENGYYNLKVSAPSQMKHSELSIAVRKDWPELVTILNKALLSISRVERQKISNKWLIHHYKTGASTTDILLWAVPVSIITILIVSYILSRNRLLNSEVLKRKQTEVDLKKAKERAEESNKMKSEFVANISHEIRTPMNSILGFSELLDEKITDPEHSKYIKAIRSSGNSLLKLINDILDLSKLEASKFDLKPRPTHLRTLFSELETTFYPQMGAKDLDCSIDVSATTPEIIVIDGQRLRQVLTNIVGNAVKFTDHGTITISSECESSENNLVDLTIIIRDTGHGIRESDLKLIFNPFEQADMKQTTKHAGTGLGLSISKKLINLMGGSITAESVIDEGTTFTILFPDVSSTTATHTTQSGINIPLVTFNEQTIFIVDDNQTNLDLAVSFLKDTNLELVEAKSGKSCLELIKSQVPDLILMDEKMPDITGSETAKQVRAISGFENIPIIAVTASPTSCDKQQFDAIITKPLSRGRVLGELMNHISYTDLMGEKHSQNRSTHVLRPYLDADINNCDILIDEWKKRDKFSVRQTREFIAKVSEHADETNDTALKSWVERATELLEQFEEELLSKHLNIFNKDRMGE